MSVENIESKYSEYLETWHVFEREKEINVSLVVVHPEARGKGLGRQIFLDLTNYADQAGKTIILTPDASFGTSKAKLVKFYKSLGFVMNKGRNKDYEISELMYRRPATVKEAVRREIRKLLDKEALFIR